MKHFILLLLDWIFLHTIPFFFLAANACVCVLSVLSKECPLGLIDSSNELQEVTDKDIIIIIIVIMVIVIIEVCFSLFYFILFHFI